MLDRLQKVDQDTTDLIDMVQKYLFSVGVRASKERAWDIFQCIHKMPYELMIKRNDKIQYQGQGKHITHKHGNQLLVIRDVGRFELKGASSRKDKKKKAKIKFTPSNDIKTLVEESIEVIE